MAGSQSASCAGNGKCKCNAGYEGQRCSQCSKGFYMKWLNSQYTCLGINALVVVICSTWLQFSFKFYSFCSFSV